MTRDLVAFLHETRLADLPATVVADAERCLLDLVGVIAGGIQTDVSRIVRNHAARHMGTSEGGARMMLDGRRVSVAGAAYAGATSIDAYDAHDGHVLTKGHIGVSVLPTLLAVMDDQVARGAPAMDGPELLTALVLGYEIGTRAGIVLHATACDYHTSGAWGAIACAALVSRALGLNREQTRHALGIAEYHGPRSQMMRCIDFPTMVKDGSGWGAFAGVSAAYLAADGFTGAPAITLENADVASYWSDLGTRWRLPEQYVKAYPVCRWAQPAVEAAFAIARAHKITARDIAEVEVQSFTQAIRLACREPADTDAAQYSTPFAVAAALVAGKLTASEVIGPGLTDPEVLRLARSMKLVEAERFAKLFPAERWAEVAITLRDGTVLRSAPSIARGNPENPLAIEEIVAKYHGTADPLLGTARANAITAAIGGLKTDGASVGVLREALLTTV